MANHETPKPAPENPRFALANRLVADKIALLGLLKEAYEDADIDSLTQVATREKLAADYAGLQQGESQRAGDIDQPEAADKHSLLMVDIDHFKQINDTKGHPEGDIILRKTAGLIKDTLRRKRDLVARVGGEEFAVLLPRANTEQAGQIAENIRQAAEEAGDVTLSIGVAPVNVSKSLVDNVMNADVALLAAKKQGRDQVVQYEDLAARQQNGAKP